MKTTPKVLENTLAVEEDVTLFRDKGLYMCRKCRVILEGKAWKKRRLNNSAYECPKCHTKFHLDELRFVEMG
jgi:Zn finger protein HypA/HybF involved in hydrogenase expression